MQGQRDLSFLLAKKDPDAAVDGEGWIIPGCTPSWLVSVDQKGSTTDP